MPVAFNAHCNDYSSSGAASSSCNSLAVVHFQRSGTVVRSYQRRRDSEHYSQSTKVRPRASKKRKHTLAQRIVLRRVKKEKFREKLKHHKMLHTIAEIDASDMPEVDKECVRNYLLAPILSPRPPSYPPPSAPILSPRPPSYPPPSCLLPRVPIGMSPRQAATFSRDQQLGFQRSWRSFQ